MALLTLRNLTKSFKQDNNKITIFKNLNFDLETGKTLAVMGKSGSGKSTLLSLILGLSKADEGSVLFDQRDILSLSNDECVLMRRLAIGMIFQNHNLIDTLSAWENVWLTATLREVDSPEEASKKLLELVGLSHRLNHLPTELSGGENQRVAIARALIGNPKLVLADEPNANLDSETGKVVMGLMFDLVKSRKQTLLLVTHDESLATQCDAVFRMNE